MRATSPNFANAQRCGLPLIAAALICASALSGCNLIAAGTFLIAGGDKVEAQTTLEKEKSHVIFVDDRGGVLRQRAVRDQIASSAEQRILDEKLVIEMIQGRQAVAASRTERAGKLLTIAQIGQSVKSERVIYANVDSFVLKPDGQTYQPTAVLSVKIIDSVTGAKLWPTVDQGIDSFRLSVTFREQVSNAPQGFAAEMSAEQNFAKAVGLRLAQMFYKHEVLDSNVGDSLKERRPDGFGVGGGAVGGQ